MNEQDQPRVSTPCEAQPLSEACRQPWLSERWIAGLTKMCRGACWLLMLSVIEVLAVFPITVVCLPILIAWPRAEGAVVLCVLLSFPFLDFLLARIGRGDRDRPAVRLLAWTMYVCGFRLPPHDTQPLVFAVYFLGPCLTLVYGALGRRYHALLLVIGLSWAPGLMCLIWWPELIAFGVYDADLTTGFAEMNPVASALWGATPVPFVVTMTNLILLHWLLEWRRHVGSRPMLPPEVSRPRDGDSRPRVGGSRNVAGSDAQR